MYAVIKTGGKQYKVAEGDKLRIEKVDGAPGDVVAFDEVLMLGDDKGGVTVGDPLVKGAQVMGELVDVRKAGKVVVFKKRRRQNYRRKKGHRQWEALVAISEIVAPGSKAKTKASAKPKAETKTAEKAEKPAAAKKAAPKKTAEKAEPAAAKDATKSAPTPAASKKAAAGDDLKKLTGVGPALEKKMVEAGVTSFAQIAGWKAADLDKYDELVPGLKAKAEKGDWIAEAKKLAGS
ncbi:50S ribosomal protein L21 [Marinicauda salina]|jgi:large subunit ribosomal protein L21|uniref:Large ribosomal subunit protein bL21 n=1 Tax=Marinicauda salina TaxID=2135793 RepID=A0A2U2BWY6_9PROT|nr:50S ribosomal protein L21 [Marinicauda salina]PWE18525.1 50S ribosomal protein L21 [Marinicauda salina]